MNKVIVAIDFGTTFSGVAWAQVSNVSMTLIAGYHVLTWESTLA